MKSYCEYDDLLQHCWIAAVWDDKSYYHPNIGLGIGDTKKEALKLAILNHKSKLINEEN